MGRRVVRDMRQPRRREETWQVRALTFTLVVEWQATADSWTASVRVAAAGDDGATLPVRTTVDLAAAGDALLYSAVTLQDLKRLAEDALLDLARAYLVRRYAGQPPEPTARNR